MRLRTLLATGCAVAAFTAASAHAREPVGATTLRVSSVTLTIEGTSKKDPGLQLGGPQAVDVIQQVLRGALIRAG